MQRQSKHTSRIRRGAGRIGIDRERDAVAVLRLAHHDQSMIFSKTTIAFAESQQFWLGNRGWTSQVFQRLV